jgi:hypothetical protein
MENVQFIKLELVVLAAWGIQLLKPFHAITKSNYTTHTILKSFYQALNESFCTPLDSSFFNFGVPHFPFEPSLFYGCIKETYEESVIESVRNSVRFILGLFV